MIEELIGEEILDETDVYVDVHKRIAVAKAQIQSYKRNQSEPTTYREKRSLRSRSVSITKKRVINAYCAMMLCVSCLAVHHNGITMRVYHNGITMR